jgi:hypothetical protein
MKEVALAILYVGMAIDIAASRWHTDQISHGVRMAWSLGQLAILLSTLWFVFHG